MKKTSKIISIILTVIMLMGLMTSVAFATQPLPTTFGWSTDNAGYITIDVPAFDGDEVEYYLDLYKDGNKVNHDFGVFFDASGTREADVFVDKINELGNGTYKYKIGLSRDFDTDELVNATAFSSEYVKSSGTTTPPATPDDDNTSNTPVDKTGVSTEYYDAAKVMYDLGIMPDIYTNYENNVKTLELYEIINRINPSSSSTGSDDILTENAAEKIIELLGYAPLVDMDNPTSVFAKAYTLGILDGVGVMRGSAVTHEQLAQILYNSFSIGIIEEVGYNSYNTTDKTILTEYLDVAKITANITVDGNIASISGMKYDKDNLKGIEITNVSAEIVDTDILNYADGGLLLFVKNDKILSGLEYTDAYFIINNGNEETEETTVSVKLYAYGFTKYRFVTDGASDTPYTPITNSTVSHTISNTDGRQYIKIEFANDDESLTKTVSNSITLDNKQNITFMVNGSVFKEEEQGCGKTITFPTVNIDGYWLKDWSVASDYIIPDEDITITANLIPLATIKGQLIEIDGEPATSGRSVMINAYKDYGNSNGHIYAYTDADGKFEITYPQGEYLLYVNFNGTNMTVEVNANQSIVDLGEIKKSSILPKASAQGSVETIKGLNNIINSVFTDDEKALVSTGGTYTLSCSAGGELVIDDNSNIAKAIKTDYADNSAIYYLHIGLSKTLVNEVGSFVSSTEIYETPELLEFVINIPDEVKEKDEYVVYREHTTQTEDGAATVIEKVTTEANEFGEYLTVTDGKINLFVKRFSTYAIVGIDNEEPEQPNEPDDTDEPEQPTYRPTGGGSSSSTTISVPTSTGTDVKATVSGTTATISKIDTSKASGGTSYSIDMSSVKKTVKSVKLPTSAVKDLAKEDSTVETLDIKLSSGSVSFDAGAIKTISEDAKGTQIILNINDATTKLTTTEKNTIEEISSPTVIEVSLSSNNKTISDFKGGKAIISVPYELKDGQITESVIAQRIGENGVLTAMETSYDDETNTVSFVAPHLSKYVISAVYEKDAIVLNIGEKDAKVFGETITNDVAPKIVNERTMLPIRFIAEKLGASVDWVQESQTVIIELDDIKISLVIGENFAMVNDEKIELDSASFVEDGRTFLPIRFVMENLGADVLWNNNTQTVIITK